MEDYTRYMRLLMVRCSRLFLACPSTTDTYGRLPQQVMVRAVGRLVSSGRELSHLAGYTSRVAELYNVLGDINSGTFVRTQTVREPQEGEERTVDHIDPITSRGELIEIGPSDMRTLPSLPVHDVCMRALIRDHVQQ
jgi:hypothetical protein